MVVDLNVLSLLGACFGMVYVGKVAMGSFVLRKSWKTVGKYWIAHLILEVMSVFFLVRALFFAERQSALGNAVSVALFGSLWAVSTVVMLKLIYMLTAAKENKTEE